MAGGRAEGQDGAGLKGETQRWQRGLSLPQKKGGKKCNAVEIICILGSSEAKRVLSGFHESPGAREKGAQRPAKRVNFQSE